MQYDLVFILGIPQSSHSGAAGRPGGKDNAILHIQKILPNHPSLYFLGDVVIYHELELENVGVTFECITTK